MNYIIYASPKPCKIIRIRNFSAYERLIMNLSWSKQSYFAEKKHFSSVFHQQMAMVVVHHIATLVLCSFSQSIVM